MEDRTKRRFLASWDGFVIPDPDEDFTAHPVELFFDLAFVFAFSQLVKRLVEDTSAGSIAGTALVFLLLWIPWSQYAWTANAVSAHRRSVQVVMLIATAASLPMAAGITTAFDGGGFAFAASLSVILAMGMVLLVMGYQWGSSEFQSAVRYAIPNGIAIVLLIMGAFLDGGGRVALWLVALLTIVYAMLRAGSGDWVVRPGHFAERHGLILIVALGEVIVATAIPVVAALSKGDGLNNTVLTSLAAAALFAGLLWWGYFDKPQPGLERAMASLEGRPRGRFGRDIYTFLHAPIVGGVVVSAAALEEITLHPTDVLPVEFRWMLVAGVALYLGGVGVAAYRAVRMVPPERAVAMVAVVVLALVGGSMNGLVLLAIADLILATAFVYAYVAREAHAQPAHGQ